MRKLKCFVACAFGWKDVDGNYKKIAALLKKQILLIRVDQINHNNHVDRQIIDLIGDCDFGIADLTYARPSVYYEAGYIEGMQKPVIYISKDDHFKHKPEDINGNERIHFDLITKNIIKWSRIEKDLVKRVTLVTKPIVAELEKADSNKKHIEIFNSLPLARRLSYLSWACGEILHTNKVFFFAPTLKMQNTYLAIDRAKTKAMMIRYLAKATPAEIRNARRDLSVALDYKKYAKRFLVIVSLTSISIKTIEHSFQYFVLQPGTKTIVEPENHSGEVDIITFIDNVKSAHDVRVRFADFLKKHQLLKPSAKLRENW
jgi:nucleoside 2-deoxyribosyltransferase